MIDEIGSRRLGLFGRRVAALCADLLLFFALVFPAMLLLHLGPGWRLLLSTVLPLALMVLCWVRWGATPGKFLLGLRVVDARSGETPDLRHATLRALGFVLSWLPMYLGFLWSLFDPEQRGWHDHLGGTRVIREPGLEDDPALHPGGGHA